MANRIRDQLNNASLPACASAAMTVVDRLQQNFQAAPQVVGLAAAFLFLCEHYGVEPQDAFTVTKNVIAGADKAKLPEFRAVREYIQKEIA